MKTIKINTGWMDKVLPEGLPINSSTVITGPGGSGKPLIGETFVSAWLKSGGSVVFMSLQYPSAEFVTESIKNVAGLDLNDFEEKIFFIQLDTEIEEIEEAERNKIKANLVKPEVWDEAINLATTKLPDEGPGIMIFASALNLLLFSPTYGDAILNKIIETIQRDKEKTFIFSVSTTAKAEEIKKIEDAADNLITSHSEKPPFRLYMQIKRMKDVEFDNSEIRVPISETTLQHIRQIADHSRSKVIPAISKI